MEYKGKALENQKLDNKLGCILIWALGTIGLWALILWLVWLGFSIGE